MILYLHSMESFIYKALQKGTLSQDPQLVDGLGPYAWTFQKILE